ncbi:MAG: carboxyltransferase domain-containing protein [Pseudomonadota bacterium]
MSAKTTIPILATQGVDGVVVRFSDTLTEPANRAALALRAALEGGAVPQVEEASSALASVYARFGGDPTEGCRALAELLREQNFETADLPMGCRRWTIPAAFGGRAGPAFERVASEAGLSPEDALRDLTQTPIRVMAIGFAPGQPYLGRLPEAWDIPRLPELTHVPAGAVVVAIRQLVLFTNASPTGWQHVGQTGFRTFRPDADRPFALAPGDEVSFRRVSEDDLDAIIAADTTGDGGAVAERLG